MKVKAQAKWIRIAPRKVRRVIDVIRGKNCVEALALLSFMPHKGAEIVLEVIKSAVANAKHNYKLENELYISEAFADEATPYKRWRPRSRGRAHPVKKRNSHVTIYVSPRGEEKK
ncbi:MAG: 50S ribosomal protein L22 [Candidatus Margulisbacteria bacterium]|nr:50S ribosomal protein L22 [Candidatus Margulisiibacteriota bacterium]MBU1022102.1 50S ribosomal protein L22 [Candidatus Margulisiibacteriota bacterium]MBU1729697.1 50S ribosomal protein L22 [Candidatus Margulisiibacteriota bacterium]MBU1955017.1 50S ribosomal protein L22 [Candidatus Margulisiibacteriota bacterium]